MPEIDVVADSTDPGTLRPNLVPETRTGDHFEALDCPEFEPRTNLPPDLQKDDVFGIWSLFFTLDIMQLIVDTTNQKARNRKAGPSLSNHPARKGLPGSYVRQWIDLTVRELYSYFAILIYMALCPLSDIELYWGTDRGKHEYVVSALSCNRFQDISRAFSLCIVCKGTNEFDRVYQVSNKQFVYRFTNK
jgi:hypothetical protein